MEMAPKDTGIYHGSTAIPCSFVPHNPGHHGRYLVIDLTANNMAAMLSREKETGIPPADLGFGVCRQGFGLQNFGKLTEEQANRFAVQLNRSERTAEEIERQLTDERLARMAA